MNKACVLDGIGVYSFVCPSVHVFISVITQLHLIHNFRLVQLLCGGRDSVYWFVLSTIFLEPTNTEHRGLGYFRLLVELYNTTFICLNW